MKVRGEEGRVDLRRLGVRVGNDYEVKPDDELDLRRDLKARNLFGFLRWFFSRRGREVSPGREFREELLDTGILPKDLFSKVNFASSYHELAGSYLHSLTST